MTMALIQLHKFIFDTPPHHWYTRHQWCFGLSENQLVLVPLVAGLPEIGGFWCRWLRAAKKSLVSGVTDNGRERHHNQWCW